VPETAAKTGKVKITVTFAAWKEREVQPATFEVPIVEKKPSKER
jgi:hypothetical protein